MQLQEWVSLKPYHTFGINVSCRYFAVLSSLQELKDLVAFSEEAKLPLVFLGEGSNVLITRDLNAVVAKIAFKGISLEAEDSAYVWVRVSAGENWHSFVDYSLDKQWFGLENLSLIPGSVGAAPMQNIGAYGVEVKQYIEEVQVFSLDTKQVYTIGKEDCNFGYRDSIFKQELKGKVIILSVLFKLSKTPSALVTSYGDVRKRLDAKGIDVPNPKQLAQVITEIRKEKLPDPSLIGNAGSFFKNPEILQEKFEQLLPLFPGLPNYPSEKEGYVKIAAAWLIEQCGFKGLKIGDAGVHQNQALVLVNLGNASGAELLELSNKVKNVVYQKFGIPLQTEVNIL